MPLLRYIPAPGHVHGHTQGGDTHTHTHTHTHTQGRRTLAVVIGLKPCFVFLGQTSTLADLARLRASVYYCCERAKVILRTQPAIHHAGRTSLPPHAPKVWYRSQPAVIISCGPCALSTCTLNTEHRAHCIVQEGCRDLTCTVHTAELGTTGPH